MKEALPVAVIGAGHMGRHHVQKYAEMEGARLVAVVDANLERAKELAEPLGVKYATELTPDLGDVAAVSVAVPTVNHLRVAKPLIERGVAVLVEKPLAPTLADAEEIAALARKHDAIVQVGHTERFNPAVRAVDRLGLKPKFVETHRISPFTFRSADVGVVFDMMIHDIDILLHLVREDVERRPSASCGFFASTRTCRSTTRRRSASRSRSTRTSTCSSSRASTTLRTCRSWRGSTLARW
jgi:predicted dehydrogenase